MDVFVRFQRLSSKRDFTKSCFFHIVRSCWEWCHATQRCYATIHGTHTIFNESLLWHHWLPNRLPSLTGTPFEIVNGPLVQIHFCSRESQPCSYIISTLAICKFAFVLFVPLYTAMISGHICCFYGFVCCMRFDIFVGCVKCWCLRQLNAH